MKNVIFIISGFMYALKRTDVQCFPDDTLSLFFSVGHYREKIKPVQIRDSVNILQTPCIMFLEHFPNGKHLNRNEERRRRVVRLLSTICSVLPPPLEVSRVFMEHKCSEER